MTIRRKVIPFWRGRVPAVSGRLMIDATIVW
jgi:hypothetical protein